MNERIKELAKQAEFSERDLQIQGDNFQRFAELIVRECIEKSLEEQIDPDLIDQEQDIEDRCYLRGSNSGIITAVCAIKQHFGVEE
jgi:hypothetical protein